MATVYQCTESATWRHWVTPRLARDRPVHRWYLFPHSFTGDLVHALIAEWDLGQEDSILDPFAGAGTTLLAAKEKGISCTGYDLSPLAVLVSKTKTAALSHARLATVWHALEGAVGRNDTVARSRTYPSLVRKALPEGRLDAFDALAVQIGKIDCSPAERDFFRLALLSVIPRFSHAVANGGWLRWLSEIEEDKTVEEVFKAQVEMMLSDVRCSTFDNSCSCTVGKVDARDLPESRETYTAVITSPPYPNRHDYTRVFGVELMFEFLDWKENRSLRHQSFHSHPEARPRRPLAKEYVPPEALEGCIDHLKDARIQRMLRGYFLDMYLCLREVTRVCRKGARIAFVVGNVRYGGKAILADEFTAQLGEGVGLVCQEIRAVRWRGNSAQQMGKYGRIASRESVVMFEKR